MWSSWAEPLVAWARTRYPLRVFGPLAVGLALAARAAGSPLTPGRFAGAATLAFVLVLGFRLWDDLADREHDRRAHPERVLVRATSTAPFWAAVVVIAAGNALLLVALEVSVARLTLLAFVGGSLGLWYGALRRAWPSPVVHYHVVLAKYPTVVAVLGARTPGVQTGRVLLVLALVYLGLCVYEGLHDARLRVAPGAWRALAVDAALLAVASGLGCLGIFTAVWGRPS